jgi:hypothetical protein
VIGENIRGMSAELYTILYDAVTLEILFAGPVKPWKSHQVKKKMAAADARAAAS